MSVELKPCPFCGGEGRIRQKQMRFIGQNYLGWIKERRGFYIQCRRCKARGGLASAEVIRKGMMTEDSVWREELVNGAIEAWNRRAET